MTIFGVGGFMKFIINDIAGVQQGWKIGLKNLGPEKSQLSRIFLI